MSMRILFLIQTSLWSQSKTKLKHKPAFNFSYRNETQNINSYQRVYILLSNNIKSKKDKCPAVLDLNSTR